MHNINVRSDMTKKKQRRDKDMHAFSFFFYSSTCSPTHTRRYKEYAEKLRPLVKDTVLYLHKALESGRSVLVEGANAAMLDIDFGA